MPIIKKRSVMPFYMMALVWLAFAFFLPLYALSHYLTAGIVSFAALLLTRAICPTRIYELPEPVVESEPEPEPEPEPAAEPKIEALMRERDLAIGEMRRLNDAIEDAHISEQIDKLESLTAKIIDHVLQSPDKQPQIRKFLNYYLPTTIKLLNAYDRMGSAGVSGENIDGTMKKIEDMLQTIIIAFEQQLDSLFQGEAMDISADISVLETLLAGEGLSGNAI